MEDGRVILVQATNERYGSMDLPFEGRGII